MRSIICLVVGLALSGCAALQPGQDHAAHQAAGSAAPAANHHAQADARAKPMHDMHQKMVAARIPAERHALMDANMKTMRGGKAAHGAVPAHGGPSAGKNMAQHEMLDKCMDMMETMAKDSVAAGSSASK